MATKKTKFILHNYEGEREGVFDTIEEAKKECCEGYTITEAVQEWTCEYILKFKNTPMVD